MDLYIKQHKSYAQIAEIERISSRDIHSIIKEEEEDRRQKYKQQEQSTEAYKLFFEKKSPVEVAIILNQRETEVTKLYRGYWKLRGLDKLNTIHKETMANYGQFGNYTNN
jgi:hypothetical protein